MTAEASALRPRVLLVGPAPLIAHSATLSRSHNIRVATTEQEARSSLTDFRPDLVLLDPRTGVSADIIRTCSQTTQVCLVDFPTDVARHPTPTPDASGQLLERYLQLIMRMCDAETRLHTLQHAGDSVHLFVDERDRIVATDGPTEPVLGYAQAALIGRTLGAVLPAWQRQNPNVPLSGLTRAQLLTKSSCQRQGGIARVIRQDGTSVSLEVARSDAYGPLLRISLRRLCGTLDAQLRRLTQASPRVPRTAQSPRRTTPDGVSSLNGAIDAQLGILQQLVGPSIRLTKQLSPRAPNVRIAPADLAKLITSLILYAQSSLTEPGTIQLSTSSRAPYTSERDIGGRSIPHQIYATLTVSVRTPYPAPQTPDTGKSGPRSANPDAGFARRIGLVRRIAIATRIYVVVQSGSPNPGLVTILFPPGR